MSFTFEWDDQRHTENKEKHGVDSETAQYAFFDDNRLTARVSCLVRGFSQDVWLDCKSLP